MDAAPPAPDIPEDGLILWLAADRDVTERAGLVSRWDDGSPLRVSATQDLAEMQPTFIQNGLGGRPALRFDGNDDFLQLPQGYSDFTNGLSIFAVAQADGPSCTAIFEASNGGEIDDISLGQADTQINYEVLDTNNTDAVFPVMVPVEVGVVHHVDEHAEIRRNGLFGAGMPIPLPAVIERKGVYIGRSLYNGCPSFGGVIAEVILYSRALADPEVLTVEKYLQTKYGCCGSN